ncbi:MAG TPA: hypothetical protein VFK18_03630, partial [Luteimonas sp.]|nr:hypothetical protein [Luteimonas sp.]
VMTSRTALLLVVMLAAGGSILWFQRDGEPKTEHVSEGAIDRITTASDLPGQDSMARDGFAGPVAGESGYLVDASELKPGVLRNYPVAIERYVDLMGACRSATSATLEGESSFDMARLRKYCRGYPGQHADGSSSDVWSNAYSVRLQRKLDDVRNERGAAAARHELGSQLANAGPFESRAILQYAGKSGLVPDILESHVDPEIVGTALMNEQFQLLSQIEFCRKGGDCRPQALSTLLACVSLGPCQGNESLVSVFRRNSPPVSFQAAMRLSDELARLRE